jgi:hypothetical protein
MAKRLRGRPKGPALTETIREYLRVYDIDVVGDFLDNLAMIEDPTIRNDQLLRFMEFIYPKAKQEIGLEITNAPKERLVSIIPELLERVEREMAQDQINTPKLLESTEENQPQ